MGDAPLAGDVRAAGAVLWRTGTNGAGVEVALIHRPRYDDWSLPKGKAKPGEHPLVNAVREVAEETGVRPVLGRPLGRSRYQVRAVPKRVDYWAATPAPPPSAQRSIGLHGQHVPNGSAASRVCGDSAELGGGGEVDKLEWLPVDVAMRRLSYQRDAAILGEFAARPNATVPYILLRHASAGRKGDGPSDDRLRPLDEAGAVQAATLAALLGCFGSARAFSSATARCVETVLPYGLAAGVPVTADPALTWGAGGGAEASEAVASARLAGLLADRAATIVCGHGETLPDMLAQACRYFGAALPSEPSLDKAAFWVLHVAPHAAERFVVLERHGIG